MIRACPGSDGSAAAMFWDEGEMTAETIVNWALRNAFVPDGDRCFRGNRNGFNVSIEIKRASFVVISDGGGRTPSVVSKRFKDVLYDHDNGEIIGIKELAGSNVRTGC
jgi:hypothetical protein